jgi:hypothetical protein
MKDENLVFQKINKIIRDGATKLQVINLNFDCFIIATVHYY